MDNAPAIARVAMAEGALLALLSQWNGDHTRKADRVTVSLSWFDGTSFMDVQYWNGDIPVGGEGF